MGKTCFCSTKNNTKYTTIQNAQLVKCPVILVTSDSLRHTIIAQPRLLSRFSIRLGVNEPPRPPLSPAMQRLLLSAVLMVSVKSEGHAGFTTTRHPDALRPKATEQGVRAGSQGEIRVSQFRVSYEIKSRHPGNRRQGLIFFF